MADAGFSVPINMTAVNEMLPIIAKGPDYSWIGNIPDSYWAGPNQQYQQRNRNLFQEGIPRDAAGNVDWGRAGEQIMRAAGASGAPVASSLSVDADLQRMLANRAPGYGVSGGAPAAAEVPAAPRAELPPSTGATPGIPTAPATPAPAAGGFTIAKVAEGNGLDPIALANETRLPPDTKITPENREEIAYAVRKLQAVPTSVAAATPATATDATTVAAPRPVPAAPASAEPPAAPNTVVAQGFDQTMANPLYRAQQEQMARVFEQQAQDNFRLGTALNMRKPGTGDGLIKQGQAAAEQARAIRESAIKSGEMTPEQRNLLTGTTEANKVAELDIATGAEKLKGIIGQATQYTRDLKTFNELSRGILSDPSMYTGAGGQASFNWNRIKSVFGDTKAAQLQDTLSKVTAASILSQMNTQKTQMAEDGGSGGRTFASQLDQIQKASPGLGTTLAGNRTLIEITDRMGRLAEGVKDEAVKYINEKRARGEPAYLDTAGWETRLSKYLKAHPVFTPEEVSQPERLGAPDVPPAIAKDKTAIQRWGTALGVGNGEPIRFPGGQVRSFFVQDARGQKYPARPQTVVP